jgi:biopolymer transport protein ExbD
MAKRHKRSKSGGGLNLVSLMDIFTILVFFLLVNSSDVEVLPSQKDIELPESVAEEKAQESVVIMIDDQHILVQGRPVVAIADAMSGTGVEIPELRKALESQNQRELRRDSTDVVSREVTIMGDKEISYRLLKKVMATCTRSDYGQISLAVMQKSAELGQTVAAASP